MSPRYLRLIKQMRTMDRLAVIEREISDRTKLTVFLRHPSLLWQLAKVALRGQTVSAKDGGLGQQDAGSAESDVDEPTDIAPGDRSVADIVDEAQRDIQEAVAMRQVDSAIQHARERDLYQPAYLDSEPYLRLRLRDIRYSINDDTIVDFGEGQSAAVHLLAHRSGVYQVLIPCRLPRGVDTDKLIPRTIASGVRLRWVEVAEPVLTPFVKHAGQPGDELTGEWLTEAAEGTRWRHFDKDCGTLADVFQIYLAAVEHIIGFEIVGEAWHCYASAFLIPACCPSEKAWRRTHPRELSGLLARHPSYRELRTDPPLGLPRNSAITTDHSSWIGSASATVISWDAHELRTRFDSHLWTLLLVENFLLQNWQIRSMVAELALAQSDDATARALQRRLIHGLGEFYTSNLSFGTAQAIVAELLEGAGTTRISRTRVRVAPPAACTRRPVAAIRAIALANSPESVG